jgi:ribonuclease HI
MRQFFRASLNPSPPTGPVLDNDGVYDPQKNRDIIRQKYEEWIPPMSPPVPDLPIATRILQWADSNSISVHYAIRKELEKGCKFKTEIWDDVVQPISVEEVRSQCRGRQCSPGITRISYRMIMYSAENIAELIAEELTRILDNGVIPASLKRAIMRPIPKTAGIPVEVASRSITLLETMSKVFTGIISKRIQEVMVKHQVILNAQYAFLRNKHIQTPLKIKTNCEELARSLGKQLYIVELDIGKAYDHTRSHFLDTGCYRMGLPDNLCSLVRNMRQSAFSHLLYQREFLTKLKADTLRQGCPLSCLLFNFQLDILVSALDNELHGFTCGNMMVPVKIQAYADDIVTYHDTLEDAVKALDICHSFCNLQQQKINAKKTVLRIVHGDVPTEPILVNGEPITIVTEDQPTRYLGLYLTPNGSLHPTRNHVYSILQRANCLLHGKQTSTALRTLLVNRSIAPKLTYMLAKIPMRLLDLESFTRRMQEIVMPEIDIETSLALYAPHSHGGAGLFHLTTQICSQHIKLLLEELNPSPLKDQSDRLHGTPANGDFVIHSEEQQRFRRRNMELCHMSQWTTELLMEQAKSELLTSCSPLTIPTESFIAESNAAISSIRCAREYLSYLQATVMDSEEDVCRELDIHHLVGATDVTTIYKAKGGRDLLHKIATLVPDGWSLMDGSPILRKATQTAAMLIRPYNIASHPDIGRNGVVQRPACWKNWHTCPNRLPIRQQLKAGDSYIVAYKWTYTLMESDILLHPKFGRLISGDIDRASRPTTELAQVQPLVLDATSWELHGKTGSNENEYVDSNVLISYFRMDEDQVDQTRQTITLPEKRFKRDCLVLLNECIRRMRQYSWPSLEAQHHASFLTRPTIEGPASNKEPEYFIFSDGSSTQWGTYTVDGAGAVIVGHDWKHQARYFAHTLPPIDNLKVGRTMGSIRSEVAGACLGILAFCIHFPSDAVCKLYIDNKALCDTINNVNNWERLLTYDGHYGCLLWEFLKRNIVHSAEWIRAHQEDSADKFVMANNAADILADAARRRAPIAGEYLDLPLPSGSQRYTVCNYATGFQLPELPHIQSKRTVTHLPLPDPSSCFLRLQQREWQQRTAAVTFGKWMKSPVLPQDDNYHLDINFYSLRIRASLLPTAIQQMVNRPDVFGSQPACVACKTVLTATTYDHVWNHYLYYCTDPDIRAAIVQPRRKMDLLLASHAVQEYRQRSGPAESLTYVNDHQLETVSFTKCKCSFTRLQQNCAALSQRHNISPCIVSAGSIIESESDVTNAPLDQKTIHWEAYHYLQEHPVMGARWIKDFQLIGSSSSYLLNLNPSCYAILRKIFPEADDILISIDVPTPPQETNVSQLSTLASQSSSDPFNPERPGRLWLRPSVTVNPGPAPSDGWTPIMGWRDHNVWWTEAQQRGIACCHLVQYVPKGIIAYVSTEYPVTKSGPIALRDIRLLWKQLYITRTPSTEPFLWLAKGREIQQHCRNVPGIEIVPSWHHNFTVPQEDVCASQSQLLFWLGYPIKQAISTYSTRRIKTAAAVSLATAFRNLYKALGQLLRVRRRAYDKENKIPQDILRVMKHLQEWTHSSDARPFCDYTDTEKEQVVERLRTNRKRLAQQQTALAVRPVFQPG